MPPSLHATPIDAPTRRLNVELWDAAMKAKELNLTAQAEKLGTSRWTLRRLRNGSPICDFELGLDMAELAEVDVFELFPRERDKPASVAA